MLSNKIAYGKQRAYKYYAGSLQGGFIPLYIVIPQKNSYTDDMNILANDKEFSKYIEMWNKIKDLFKNLSNKRDLYKEPAYNNEYISAKISPFNKIIHGNKKLIKSEYYSTSVLSIESICEVKNKYYPETF